MSDDRDHTITIATATVASEEKPFGLLLSGLGACTAITLAYIVQDRNSRWIDRLIRTTTAVA
jgi:uncharacterized OsmC-like protein